MCSCWDGELCKKYDAYSAFFHLDGLYLYVGMFPEGMIFHDIPTVQKFHFAFNSVSNCSCMLTKIFKWMCFLLGFLVLPPTSQQMPVCGLVTKLCMNEWMNDIPDVGGVLQVTSCNNFLKNFILFCKSIYWRLLNEHGKLVSNPPHLVCSSGNELCLSHKLHILLPAPGL